MIGDSCQATGLIVTEDIVVQFRATNNGGTTTGGSTAYHYDNTGPSSPDLLEPTYGSGVEVSFVDVVR